jgi:hypothetical protein
MIQWFDDDDERNDFITSKYLARNVLKALQFMHRIVVGVLQENFEWIPHAAANVLDRSASLTAARTHEETFSHPAMRGAAAEDVASFTRPATRGAAHGAHFIIAVGLHLENEAHLTHNAVFEGNGRGLHSDALPCNAGPFIRALKKIIFVAAQAAAAVSSCSRCDALSQAAAAVTRCLKLQQL